MCVHQNSVAIDLIKRCEPNAASLCSWVACSPSISHERWADPVAGLSLCDPDPDLGSVPPRTVGGLSLYDRGTVPIRSRSRRGSVPLRICPSADPKARLKGLSPCGWSGTLVDLAERHVVEVGGAGGAE